MTTVHKKNKLSRSELAAERRQESDGEMDVRQQPEEGAEGTAVPAPLPMEKLTAELDAVLAGLKENRGQSRGQAVRAAARGRRTPGLAGFRESGGSAAMARPSGRAPLRERAQAEPAAQPARSDPNELASAALSCLKAKRGTQGCRRARAQPLQPSEPASGAILREMPQELTRLVMKHLKDELGNPTWACVWQREAEETFLETWASVRAVCKDTRAFGPSIGPRACGDMTFFVPHEEVGRVFDLDDALPDQAFY